MSALPRKHGKPNFISHYLVLKDLIDGVDVRTFSDNIVYLTARIENVKYELSKRGLLFDEDAIVTSKYTAYKPYVLINTEVNMKLAKELLAEYETKKVTEFLSKKDEGKKGKY